MRQPKLTAVPNPNETEPAVSADALAEALGQAERVVVLTGAGISTESGIPDFRGPNGVWTKNPKAEKLSHIDAYISDPQVRVEAWRLRLEHPAWTAEPNAAHRALVDLERKGKLDTLITQNIDGLHQKAGTSPDRLVEIHGTIREVMCLDCGERAPMQRALDRVRAGEDDPACRTCGGILKSATVSFGQPLVAEDLGRAQRAAESCSVFIAIGTSLGVYPVAYLPQVALENGARLAILNAEPTPFDVYADWIVRDPVGESLPQIVSKI
jgi:NAD-dependent deacetylase